MAIFCHNEKAKNCKAKNRQKHQEAFEAIDDTDIPTVVSRLKA